MDKGMKYCIYVPIRRRITGCIYLPYYKGIGNGKVSPQTENCSQVKQALGYHVIGSQIVVNISTNFWVNL